jgi:copper chaperone CopZ
VASRGLFARVTGHSFTLPSAGQQGTHIMSTKTFVVPNISCGHCVHTVESELSDLAGVTSVKADQATKQVVVSWEAPATWDTIVATLREIDYPPAPEVAVQ